MSAGLGPVPPPPPSRAADGIGAGPRHPNSSTAEKGSFSRPLSHHLKMIVDTNARVK